MKVLVADDEVISRTILENVLRRLGYEPTLTANGREAMARIQREEIPLLITDWQMPDIDGLELCRWLRAPGRKVYTYAILLTARSGKANYLAALEAGADDFLTKPVDAAELAAGLKAVAMKMMPLTVPEAEGFYAVHRQRPFFPSLVAYMTSGPVIVQVLEGENAVQRNREVMGATNPANAAEGTIRKLFARSIEANSVHGSDSPENAQAEIAYFFPQIDVVRYEWKR